jgi:hypothetical protein
MEEKRGGDRETARDGSIHYITTFFSIGEGIGKLLKLLLTCNKIMSM